MPPVKEVLLHALPNLTFWLIQADRLLFVDSDQRSRELGPILSFGPRPGVRGQFNGVLPSILVLLIGGLLINYLPQVDK